jgi:hypothetical protein
VRRELLGPKDVRIVNVAETRKPFGFLDSVLLHLGTVDLVQALPRRVVGCWVPPRPRAAQRVDVKDLARVGM